MTPIYGHGVADSSLPREYGGCLEYTNKRSVAPLSTNFRALDYDRTRSLVSCADARTF